MKSPIHAYGSVLSHLLHTALHPHLDSDFAVRCRTFAEREICRERDEKARHIRTPVCAHFYGGLWCALSSKELVCEEIINIQIFPKKSALLQPGYPCFPFAR